MSETKRGKELKAFLDCLEPGQGAMDSAHIRWIIGVYESSLTREHLNKTD